MLMNHLDPVLKQTPRDVPEREIPTSPSSTPVSSFRGPSPKAATPSSHSMIPQAYNPSAGPHPPPPCLLLASCHFGNHLINLPAHSSEQQTSVHEAALKSQQQRLQVRHHFAHPHGGVPACASRRAYAGGSSVLSHLKKGQNALTPKRTPQWWRHGGEELGK